MANNNQFEWVKPYDGNTDRPINNGAGYLSGVSEGFPLQWKVLTPNYGRLLRTGKYKFKTNDQDFTGSTSKSSITKFATLYQHGQSIFVTGQFNALEVANNTVVFNLWSNTNNGVIDTLDSQETNAQFFVISIRPAPAGDTWTSSNHTFTQVTWISNISQRKKYLNSVRDLTFYEFTIANSNYSASANTYQEYDTDNSYKFKMMYEQNNVKITTGAQEDIEEYFDNLSSVKSIDFSTLNSSEYTFSTSNGGTTTFQQYYNNLLTKGEREVFKYHFKTDVNPELKTQSLFFSAFRDNQSEYYIGPDDMLHLIVTIKPYGYKTLVQDTNENSPWWNYEPYDINVYIINYSFNPYLYLNHDTSEDDYTSNQISATEGTENMPVFSNRGWDITTEGQTDYVGYSNNMNMIVSN